ncbi:MAG: head-tail connector protein [Holosporales bacterium]|nr:head-tail connector protein [Holosporales bacterium]
MNIVIEPSKIQMIDLSDLKAHLRIDHDHEDDYLKHIIEIATSILEDTIERPILKKTYRYIAYKDNVSSPRTIELPVRYVDKIISVESKFPRGDHEKIKFGAVVEFNKTFVVSDTLKYPVEIKYTAGVVEDYAEIPRDLQYVALQIARNIYVCSDEDILSFGYIRDIIDKYRSITLD